MTSGQVDTQQQMETIVKKLATWAASLGMLVAVSSAAHAVHADGMPIMGEGAFLQQYGEHAKPLAKGVYLLSRPGGQSLRVSFGADGLRYERALVEQEIAALHHAEGMSDTSTEQQRARLMEDLEALSLKNGPISKAQTAIVCGVNYSTSAYASGDFAYASANASASVAPDGFGPPNPFAQYLRVTSKAYSAPSGWIYGPTRTLSALQGSVSTSAGNAGPDFCTYAKATSQVTIYGCGDPQSYLATSIFDPCGLFGLGGGGNK